jgi:2-polyprenyl-3-methyl-5-hydroxy-6-metoxy-1,4-benzoquinol methylase
MTAPGQSFDPQHRAEFDRYAQSYEALHAASIGASGEGTEYFAVYKQRVLERMLGRGFSEPVLDFGCGIGNLTRFLVDSFSVVHGYDPSAESVKLASTRAPQATFFDDTAALPRATYGVAVLANVLHHVPSPDRPSLLRTLTETLRPGGRLVVFEHNPLNPVTRRAVAACPFDEGVELLAPWTAKRLLREAGLDRVGLDYIVFFPRPLAALRAVEPYLDWLPLGAQVCAWGFKP